MPHLAIDSQVPKQKKEVTMTFEVQHYLQLAQSRMTSSKFLIKVIIQMTGSKTSARLPPIGLQRSPVQ